MNDLLLTDDELTALTGYQRSHDRARWLKKNGIRFTRQRLTGKVVVVRDWLSAPSQKQPERKGPNLDWIKPKAA